MSDPYFKGVSRYSRAGTIHLWKPGITSRLVFAKCSNLIEQAKDIQPITEGVNHCKKCFPETPATKGAV